VSRASRAGYVSSHRDERCYGLDHADASVAINFVTQDDTKMLREIEQF
jgi:hypothetical protein